MDHYLSIYDLLICIPTIILFGIPLILLIATLGGHFLASGISSVRRNLFAMMFLIGYGLAMSLLPAFLIATFHLHSSNNFFIHIHDPSDTVIHMGIFKIDILTFFLANIVLLVFLIALEINQLAMWKAYSRFERDSKPDMAREIRFQYNFPELAEIKLLIVENPKPEAYTFTLLRRKLFFVPFRSKDVLAITTGLIDILSKEELEVVIAHEIAHIRSLDTVFLPLFKTLSSLIFFDWILKFVRKRIVNSREFLADEAAAYETGQPLALARSLLKMYEFMQNNPPKANSVPLLEGPPIPLLVKRIDRLIKLSKRIGGGSLNRKRSVLFTNL
ncbi:MAG: M56 family metallopeptidase [Candidatus Heimdallarchaeota archaeon]